MSTLYERIVPMIKLIALDMDGTLLTSDHKISPATLEHLALCEQKGIEWLIVTGRNKDIVTPILKTYALHCDLILNSGHEYVSADIHSYKCIPMKEESVRYILAILLANDYHLSVHTNQGKYIFTSREAYFQEHIEIMKKKRKSNLEGLEHSALTQKELFLYNCHEVKTIDALFATNAQVLKIDARNMDLEKVHKSLPLIKAMPDIVVHSSYESFLEISDTKADKAIMLADVIKEKGIKPEEVAIFGDSMNDVELFEMFEHSFAMDNANEKVKALAKWVTSSNDEDGVAKGISFILHEVGS